jgi:hypothetical protein
MWGVDLTYLDVKMNLARERSVERVALWVRSEEFCFGRRRAPNRTVASGVLHKLAGVTGPSWLVAPANGVGMPLFFDNSVDREVNP